MIRFAVRSDIEAIMDFINKIWWRKGILLGSDRDFFEYEHLLEEGVTYVISENDRGEINAILGYIPYGKKHRDIMTVMWMADHTERPALGLKLLLFLKDNADVRILASPGSKKQTEGLYTYLGYDFGQMVQWYRLNKREKYRIAKIQDSVIPEVNIRPAEFVKLESWQEMESLFDFENYYKGNPKPLKESWYIKKRYFDHPVYKYEIFGIKADTKIRTIFVFRQIAVNSSFVLKWVDCIGDWKQIRMSTSMVDHLLDEYDAEYAYCYETGLPDQLFLEAGWRKTGQSGNTIPNYFEPFVQENIDVYYFTTEPEIVLFSGDGDQDRPN